MVVSTWYLKIMDRNDKPAIISFNIEEGKPPLTMELDVKLFANTMNLAIPPAIKTKKPSDRQERQFLTYTGKDNNNDLGT